MHPARSLLAALLALSSFASAADWPHWRGPHRNGISDEKGWTANWGAAGPKVLWKASVGLGFASFTVADGRVYTTGHADNTDTVFCFDAATGKAHLETQLPRRSRRQVLRRRHLGHADGRTADGSIN